MAPQNPHDGSSFESLLKEEGVLEETRKRALKAVRAWRRARTTSTTLSPAGLTRGSDAAPLSDARA
jgi:hypothetical protein